LALPRSENSPTPVRDPSSMRTSVATICAFVAMSCSYDLGCGHTSTRSDESAPSTQAREQAEARRLGDAEVPLPPRDEVLALEQAVAAAAGQEGAGARASQLYAVAARLAERLWRIEGNDDDANRALELYKNASLDPQLPGACESARAAALLAGERAHDAAITYAELYRVDRRFMAVGSKGNTGEECRRALDADLVRLAAFRPGKAVLDTIDQTLEGEGTLGLDGADSGAAIEGPPRLVHIDVWPGDDAARVVVSLDKQASYRVSDEVASSGAAAQTFVDLDGVDLGSVSREVAESGIVRLVRAEATHTGSRLMLELQGHAWRRVFAMPEPFRIVIDIARNPPGAQTHGTREVSRVVLDPGHGGRDTGAVGPTGVVEKDVTLDIAHRAARVLVGQGIEVLLTRDDDRFVALEERAARANSFSADLFVSIHCNASEGRGRRGVETYVLDASRDEIAARVAARENEMTPTASAELAQMLGGLRLLDQERHSTQFARLLQRSATTAIRMKYGEAVEGGVHFAGFYVLVGARMPSALFETSYISNPVEEQRLDSADFRQLLADAVVNAIRAYREGR
jgi:N-acetylmuramoyl-L-alanine amidase